MSWVMRVKTLYFSVLGRSLLLGLGLMLLGAPCIGAMSVKGQLQKASSNPRYLRKQTDQTLMGLAHWGALNRHATQALVIVNQLLLRQNPVLTQSELFLLKGRILFQMNQFSEAIESYNRVSKESDLWLLSVEERAWSKVRMGKKNEALADSKTLMSPVFSTAISPESYFLSAYVAYSVCDFPTVFKVIDLFKSRNRNRLIHLEKLQRLEKTVLVRDFVNQVRLGGLSTAYSKHVISFMPKLFERDRHIKSLVQRPQVFNEGTLRQGLARLSKQELQHYNDVIGKLHLIEADVIQRLYLDKELMGKRSAPSGQIRKNSQDLVFKYDENDVWVDEIDKIQVKSQICPKTSRYGVRL